MPHAGLTGRENRGLSNRGHCNRVTETGKAVWEYGATWRIRLNGPTSCKCVEWLRHGTTSIASASVSLIVIPGCRDVCLFVCLPVIRRPTAYHD